MSKGVFQTHIYLYLKIKVLDHKSLITYWKKKLITYIKHY